MAFSRPMGRGRAVAKKGWPSPTNVKAFVVGLGIVMLLVARRNIDSGTKQVKAPVSPSPPPQRCDYTLDEQHYSSYYEDQCWKNFSVPDLGDSEGASRAIYDHGALYMKSVIDFEEAKRFRTYLTSVVSPRTLDGEEYFVGNLRDPDGRYDIRLDPREHAPVMDMLNKVVGRLKPTLEKIVGPKAELVDFSAYVTCNSSAQHTHQDACALCCPIKDKYESRMEEVESIFDFNDRDRIAILKPKYYANKEQSQVYSMFVALQPTTKERNGVTFTYPDSHRLFVWDNAEDDIAGESVERELGDVARKKYQRCEPPLNTGDGFIYNSKTFHAANANPSISARMMLLIAFQSGEERKGLPLGSTYSIQRDFLRMQPGKVTRTGMEDEPDYYSTKCMTQANTAASNQMKVRGKVSLDKFPLTVDSLSSILASGNNLFFGR